MLINWTLVHKPQQYLLHAGRPSHHTTTNAKIKPERERERERDPVNCSLYIINCINRHGSPAEKAL